MNKARAASLDTQTVIATAQSHSGARARGRRALPALQLHDLRSPPHSDHCMVADSIDRVDGARRADRRARHCVGRTPITRRSANCSKPTSTAWTTSSGKRWRDEEVGLTEYRKLLSLVAGENIMLEEFARAQIAAEEQHLAEIRKMMRRSA